MTEELIRNYWNARARGYAIATVNDADPEDTRRWRGVLEDVLAPLEDKADVRILDVGCGPGLFSLLAAERLPNARVTALDGSPAMLEELKASAEARGLLERITLVEGDAGAIDEEGVYDLVMSRNVLEPPRRRRGVEGLVAGAQDGRDAPHRGRQPLPLFDRRDARRGRRREARAEEPRPEDLRERRPGRDGRACEDAPFDA